MITPQQLKRIAFEKPCVAVVGAGMEMPPVPTWWKAVKDIAVLCGVPFNDDHVTPAMLPDIIDQCLEKDEYIYREALRVVIPETTAATRTGLGFILRLPFHTILTSNFDPRIMREARRDEWEHCIAYPMLTPHLGYKKTIVYFHGMFRADDSRSDPHHLVFGKKSFEEAYSDNSLLPGFLKNVFTYHNVLFLGFNPLEPNMATLLKHSILIRRSIFGKILRSDEEPRRFALLGWKTAKTDKEQAEQDAYRTELEALGVTPVFYPLMNPDHRELDEILYSWVEEGDIATQSPPFRTAY